MKSPQLLPVIVIALLLAASAQAKESWVFQRSYYSHDPITQVRIGPATSGGPYYTRPQGAYVKSGYRNIRSTINVGGNSYNHVNVWESWGQAGQQF